MTPYPSPAALDLIVNAEIGSEANYNATECHPTWPGADSGVTIGIGYDLGMGSEAQFRADWAGLLPDAVMDSLATCCGVHGPVARAMAQYRAGLTIPIDAARSVFLARSIPKAIADTLRVYPTAGDLSPDSFGALVSLVFNRGTSLDGDRRREMMQIAKALPTHPELVPDLIRSMKRLWIGQGVDGLLARRDAEADLFAQGLAVPAVETIETPAVAAPVPAPVAPADIGGR